MELTERSEREAVWARLHALLALDGQAAERQELRAAGVLESKINALFPSDFAECVGGIEALLASGQAANVAPKETFVYATGLLRGMWRRKEFRTDQRFYARYDEFADTEDYGLLLNSFRLNLTGVEIYKRAVHAIDALWLAHWAATVAPAAADAIAAPLTVVLDWALPDLPLRVENLMTKIGTSS